MMVDYSHHAQIMRHGWPVVVVGVIVVAAGLATMPWSKYRNNAPRHTFVLPCLLDLIEALGENWERLQLEFEDSPEDWNHYVDVLCKKLDAVKKELEVKGTSLDRVAKVIDKELVDFLRLDSAVLSILDRHLPRPGQTWDGFFQTKSEDERNFYESEVPRGEQGRVELVKILRDLIDELQSILEQSHFIDVSRATDDDQLEETVYKIVKVGYATDRVVTVDAEYIGRRSKREGNLQYGFVEVAIPCRHEKGKLEAPKESGVEADPSKHIMIFSVTTNLRGDLPRFLECVNNDLTIGQGTNEVLVYIHGYNTSHLKAVKQAAQLKNDLDFKGTIILYSWPTYGTFFGYNTDEKTIKETTDSLHELLKSIMNKVKAPRVHILAHSMGNRALIGALDKLHDDLKEAGQLRLGCPLSQIVFIAADEERSRFVKLAQKVEETYKSIFSTDATSRVNTSGSSSSEIGVNPDIRDIQPHLSVYCSTEDTALRTSRWKHGSKHRLGDTRSLFNSEAAQDENHDLIDTTGIDQGTSKYRHSYHLQSPKVIEDLQVLLTRRMPASERTSRLSRVEQKGKTFYAFEKEPWNSSPWCIG